MRRKRGQASIEETSPGKWRVRAYINGKLATVASGLSRANALEVADGYQVVNAAAVSRNGVTFTQFGVGFMARRERAGVRDVGHDRSQWAKHVDGDPLGAMAVSNIELVDLIDWLDRRAHLAFSTREKLRNLVRTALKQAVQRGLIKVNPARELEVHESGDVSDTDNLDGILLPHEQKALLAVVPEQDRPLVQFALFAGVRQAEQWWLEWESCSDERVVIRRSVGGLPPKAGGPRVAELLPPARHALAAMFSQVRTPSPRQTRTFAVRDCRWVFPALRGGRRPEGKAPEAWHDWVKAAGIDRYVRWHDLRHTCATSLLAGWWGNRKWSLDEVCKMLGHSSVQVTERYARKLNETLRTAVAETSVSMFQDWNIPSEKPQEQRAFLGSSAAFLKPRSQVRSLLGAQGKKAPESHQAESGLEHSWNDGPQHPLPALALALAADAVFARRVEVRL